MKIKKGDKVVVIAGRDKGKIGEVISAIPKSGRVIVEGVNKITKHQKPTPKMQQGGRIEKESTIDVSNVMLYSEKDQKAIRVGYKMENGKKVRINKKSGEILG